MPEGLETIGREAFAWSGKLTCLHLPLSIKEIGWYAFAETGGMDLYAHWEMPIRLKEPIKDTLPKTLYVPLGTTDLYKERGWNGFDIKEFDYTDIPIIKGENDYSRKIARFNLNGTLFEPDKKGVCIERLEDGAVRKILIIIDTMQTQVDYLREKRIMEVKSAISKIPTKISVISVFFFIPLILLIILGPVLINYLG